MLEAIKPTATLVVDSDYNDLASTDERSNAERRSNLIRSQNGLAKRKSFPSVFSVSELQS